MTLAQAAGLFGLLVIATVIGYFIQQVELKAQSGIKRQLKNQKTAEQPMSDSEIATLLMSSNSDANLLEDEWGTIEDIDLM